ncbi:unnamed protein product [Larinioides sclopetarius]|uniref:ATP synthase subunit d, mitochondrial n=1 Tax=Larinioides sclopetarius TaxID=280406 RepID=A0AAV2A854_9ARAC
MASKRFVRSAIDWAAFTQRVPPSEKLKFQAFKAKVDGYTKKLMSYPEKCPSIDFQMYRSRLPNPAMVDEFEKQFNAVKIPYPADKLTPLIDEQEKKVVQWWKDMMPFDEMTMDDFKDYFPDPKLDVYETPNFWPHDEPPRPVFPYLEQKDH